MSKVIQSSDVALKTASVEIKVMTVNGKQMTLAVFRQLPRAQLVTNDGALLGTPWGSVNYHHGCAESRPHQHIVFVSGGDLCHSVVYAAPPHHNTHLDNVQERQSELRTATIRVLAAMALEGNPYRPDWAMGGRDFTSHRLRPAGVIIDGSTWTVKDLSPNSQGLGYELASYYYGMTPPEHGEHYSRRFFEQACAKWGVTSARDEVAEFRLVVESLRTAERLRDEHKTAWERTYQDLQQLPQLFIAV